MKYAVIVQSKEVIGASGDVFSFEGELHQAIVEPDGWVEATSSPWKKGEPLRLDVKLFDSREKAIEFAKRWKGHPWWCKPNGNYIIVGLQPQWKKVQAGWKITSRKIVTKKETDNA